MPISNKAINKYTDCHHKMIFNGLFTETEILLLVGC